MVIIFFDMQHWIVDVKMTYCLVHIKRYIRCLFGTNIRKAVSENLYHFRWPSNKDVCVFAFLNLCFKIKIPSSQHNFCFSSILILQFINLNFLELIYSARLRNFFPAINLSLINSVYNYYLFILYPDSIHNLTLKISCRCL